MDDKAALPPGWIALNFDEAAHTIPVTDKKIKQQDYLTSGSLAVVDQGQIFIGGYTDDTSRRVECDLPVIVFGDHTKVIKYINFDFAAGADGIKVIKPIGAFDPKLFFYFLKVLDLPDRGYSRHFQFLRKQWLPLPPLPEQHRIVAKIEELFSELDAGVAALKRVQAALKRYRASVLKAACEGRLVPTEAELARVTVGAGSPRPVAAAAEPLSYEPADVLLTRILAERRAKWEAEHPGKKYVEPAAPEVAGLSELPEGWCWANVEQIGEVIGGLTKNQKRNALPTRLPYLRVANVYANELRLDDLLMIGVEESEIKRVLLQDGDLLVVEGNGSADQIGRVAIWRNGVVPCVHQNHIIKVRFNPVELGSFILYWLLSIGGRDQITQVASSTSGLYTLSLSKVAMLLIPLPPLTEQQRIVAEVERRLSVVEELEAMVTANLARAGRLRQAILKRAFEGKLVE